MSMILIEGWDQQDYLSWVFINGSPDAPTFVTGRIAGYALRVNGVGNYQTAQSLKTAFTASSTVYLGYGLKMPSSYAYVGNDGAFRDQGVLFWSDSGATKNLSIVPNSSGNLVVKRGDFNGTLLGTGTATLSTDTWYYIEVYAVINGTTGAVTVKVNGTSDITLTSVNTKNGTNASVDALSFHGTSSLNIPYTYDDIYLLDNNGSANNTFLGDCQVQTLMPNGNGNYSQWLGSDADSTNNYQLVDEAPYSTTDYVGTSTTGNIDTYTFADLSGSPTVYAVQARGIMQKTDSGTRSADLAARISSTDYFSSDIILSTTWTTVSKMWEQNPNTSAAWTASGVNGAEFGVKNV